MKLSDFDEFKNYCIDMYYRNCEEREAFKDAVISFDEYFKFNYLFLKEKFYTKKD